MHSENVSAPANLICVYRRSNAPRVAELVRQQGTLGGSSKLWALDSTDPSLAAWTVGEGPGGRCDLLNKLLDVAPVEGAVVVSDDDYVFSRGNLPRLLDLIDRCQFALAQPSHNRASVSSYAFCRRRPWLRARLTNFVEIGPLVVIAEHCRRAFLPFPAGWGMGWGADLLWRDRALLGDRLGIVDDVSIQHLSPLGGGYSMADEGVRSRRLLDERGLTTVEQGQATLSYWPRWSSRPSWV